MTHSARKTNNPGDEEDDQRLEALGLDRGGQVVGAALGVLRVRLGDLVAGREQARDRA